MIRKLKISPVLFWSLAFTLVFGIGFFSGRLHRAEASDRVSVLDSVKIPTFILNANDKPSSADKADFSLFWKTWKLLDEKYVQTHASTSVPTTVIPGSNQARVYGAIKGMVGSFNDPYTVFFDPEEAGAFEEQIEGNFHGVGMELAVKDGVLVVVTSLKGSPAEKANMRTGDKILEIKNDQAKKSAIDMTVEEAVKLIRGPKGTTVTLTVLKEGAQSPVEVTIVRDIINLPTLETSYDRNTGIFTIRLFSFSAQSTSLFRNALKEFVATGGNKLILDLRGNPGGYLDSAVDMASWFLPAGKVVVKEVSGQQKTEISEVSKGYNIFGDNLRMIILVDGGSASASEILAGALSEYGKAILVGTKTFGKGSVQEFIKLDDNAALKITVAKWFTPYGVSISDGGLTPKYEVKMTPEDIKFKEDSQMKKAIELLK